MSVRGKVSVGGRIRTGLGVKEGLGLRFKTEHEKNRSYLLKGRQRHKIYFNTSNCQQHQNWKTIEFFL